MWDSQGDIGVSFDESIRRPILSETQSQSVDGTEEVMQECMVSDQLREYELKQRKKNWRIGSDSNEYAEKEKRRRLQMVPRVPNLNLGKRAAEAGSEDPQRKLPHLSEGPNSGDGDFVLAGFKKKASNSKGSVHDSEGDDARFNKIDELGFRHSQSIDSRDLVQKLAELVEDDDHVTVDLAVKVLFLILYQNLLCPEHAVRLGRVAAMVENIDYAGMVQMDFCQLVVDELQVAVVKWETDGSKQNCAQGCSIVPMITGKCQAILCTIVLLQGYVAASMRGLAVMLSREPIYSQLPACDVETPPTRGFTARRMFDNGSSCEQTFFWWQKHEEIDELLVKVLKLSKELPTSCDGLRTVAGFFPASPGPRREDIVVAHNLDCGMVEGLKIAVTNIRSYFAQLKDSEEVKCARLEWNLLVFMHMVTLDLDKYNQHENADVDIEKPLENDVFVDSVTSSPICLTSNVVPIVFIVEPHVTVLCEDVAVVRTVRNPDNADVDIVGQCSEAVVVSSQPSGETILLISEAQKHEEFDTQGKCFDKFKGSPKMVVPLYICSSIWNRCSVGRSVKLMFSSKAKERVDKKDTVMFATFDSPQMSDGIGHYCVVAFNVKERRFEFLDSLNKPGSSKANRVFRMMVKNIKRAWKEGSSSFDEPLNPPTLNGFALKHVIVPIQPNGHDIGFYMFQFCNTLCSAFLTN
ncbi:hypothetical protein D1007_55082 [Hordeum vulgare]|nr:hypothetical protein D1007_55082 [Hordeum vulgare]